MIQDIKKLVGEYQAKIEKIEGELWVGWTGGKVDAYVTCIEDITAILERRNA